MLIAMFAGSLMTMAIMETSGKPWAPPVAVEPGEAGNEGETGQDGSTSLTAEQLRKISQAFALIERRFYMDVDADELVDGAIRGMLDALNDPHSVYMDAEQARHFEETTISSTFSGIGAEVTVRDGRITVVSPIKGSPAEKAGIRTDDILLSVNGESLEGLSLNEAVMKIRGPKGTKAKLLILRGDSPEPIEITVIRDDIDIETVFAEMLDNGIGKIEIRQFAEKTKERFFEELEALEAAGLKGLIIDVRSNPGGLLYEVVDLIQPFVPEGKTIVQVEDRSGKVEKQVSQGGKKPYEIVVLTNRGSASASEILAGAIKENGVGVVIGETTYGKGTVQANFDSGAGDGSTIKLTIAKWLTPNGNFIEGVGIEPNIEVSMPELFYVSPFIRGQTYGPEDNHAEVRKLQLMLDGIGYTVDRTDGYFSAATERALRKFQGDHELEQTGRLDDRTMEALERKVTEFLLKPENDLQLNKAIEYLNK
jgi:carboxyl-terminal processing protease